MIGINKHTNKPEKLQAMAVELFIQDEEIQALEAGLLQAEGRARIIAMVELAWYLRQRDCARALLLAEEAELLQAFEPLAEIETRRCNARILLLRASIKTLFVEFDQAELMASAAILEFNLIHDAHGVGDGNWVLAMLWNDRGSAEHIDTYLHLALENYQLTGDRRRIDTIRARMLSQEAFSNASQASTRLADMLAEQADWPVPVNTWILSARANIAALTDNPGAAIKFDLEAFFTAGNCGQNSQAMLCTVNASEGFATLGDLDSALEWSERGLSLARQFNWPASTAICLMQYGDVLRRLNRFDESRIQMQEAGVVMQPLAGSRSEQNMLSRLGQLELDVGNYQQALEHFVRLEQGLDGQRSPDMLIDAWRGQASALAQLGMAEQAVARATMALDLATEKGQVDEQINTLRVFAELHRDFRLPVPPDITEGTAALHYLNKARLIAESIDGYVIPGELLSQIAIEYEKCGDFRSAYINEVAATAERNKMRLDEAQKRALSMQIRGEMDKARAQIEHHIKLTETLQETNATLETLGLIGREITASLDVSAVCEALYRHVDRLLDSASFIIYLLDEKEQVLKMAFGLEDGLPYEPMQFSLDHPNSIAVRCALERREIVVDQKHDTFKIKIIPGTMEVRSMLFSPLEVGKRLLGVMTIQSQQDNAYSERECSIFRTLCAYGAIALDNARAYEEVEAARHRAFRQEQELRIAAIAFDSQEGMFIADVDFSILRINRAFSKITGYERDEVIGAPPTMFKSERHDSDFYRIITATLRTVDSWQGELWICHKKGNTFPLWLSITAVRSAENVVTHYVFSLIDITERKLAEDEIRNLAFYDSLTKLPNRRLLTERLRHALVTSERSSTAGALIFIDLDNFKTINDTRGHDVGDLLLSAVGQRLEACLRQSDTAARLGGDEFVVLLEGLSAELLDAAELAELVSQKIQLALNQPYTLQGKLHHSSPSIGVCLFKGGKESADDLLKQADLAMYQAKAAGRNTIRFFDLKMQEAVNRHAALEADLRQALENGQFVLHYQIQVDSSGRVIGAEALIRWQHPERGMVSPAEFIPLAEETGLIVTLGEWILNEACAQLTRWSLNPATADLTLAVNISARQFHDKNFVITVMQALHRQHTRPEKLKLELTESMLVDDVEKVIEKMKTLMNQGVHFSLDDFGTGYSSLSYLKRLPLEQLKIDQSFVRDIFVDANDRAIVHAIVTLGKNLGLAVIAEGVETEQQRQFLESIGCHAFQGYLFGKPVTADSMRVEGVVFDRVVVG